MAKAKKEKVIVKEEVVVEKESVEVKVEAPKAEAVKVSAPVVATGRFFVDVRPGGAVVIGKLGQVVSNPMPINKANKLADHMNNAR